MLSVRCFLAFLPAGALSSQPPPATSSTPPREWQLTFAPISHLLDNNDNFSRHGRSLAVDIPPTSPSPQPLPAPPPAIPARQASRPSHQPARRRLRRRPLVPLP